jgi:hypothetical protein
MISPLNNFKVSMFSSQAHSSEPNFASGMSARIKAIPKGFVHSTLMYTNVGITETIKKWGDLMRIFYQTEHERAVKNDLSTNYLGYWTGNQIYSL